MAAIPQEDVVTGTQENNAETEADRQSYVEPEVRILDPLGNGERQQEDNITVTQGNLTSDDHPNGDLSCEETSDTQRLIESNNEDPGANGDKTFRSSIIKFFRLCCRKAVANHSNIQEDTSENEDGTDSAIVDFRNPHGNGDGGAEGVPQENRDEDTDTEEEENNMNSQNLLDFVSATSFVCAVMMSPAIEFRMGDNIPPFVIRYIVVSLILFGLLCMFIIYRNRDKYDLTADHHVPDLNGTNIKPDIDYYLSMHAHKLAIYIFGCASTASNLVYLLNDLYCLPSFCTQPIHHFNDTLEKPEGQNPHDNTNITKYFNLQDQVSRVAVHGFQVVYFVVSIPFLCLMLKVKRRKEKHRSHGLVLLVLSCSIVVWLYTYFRETGLLPQAEDKETEATSNSTYDCLFHRTAVDVFIGSSLNPIAFPFCMEFAVAGLEVLIRVWFLRPHSHSDTERRVQSTHTGQQAKDTSCCVKPWHVVCFLGLLEAMSIKFFIIHSEFAESSHYEYLSVHELLVHIRIPIAVGRTVFKRFPALIVCVICYVITSTFKEKRKHVSSLTGTSVVLALSVGAVIVAEIIGVTHFIIQLNGTNFDDQPEIIAILCLHIADSILLIAQCSVQARLIYRVSTFVAVKKHSLYEYLHQLLSYLAMYNFMCWAINSFLESEFHKYTGLLDEEVFSKTQTHQVEEIVLNMCLPLIMYYRYISTFLFLEAKYLLKIDHVKASMSDREEDAGAEDDEQAIDDSHTD